MQDIALSSFDRSAKIEIEVRLLGRDEEAVYYVGPNPSGNTAKNYLKTEVLRTFTSAMSGQGFMLECF